MTVQCDKCGSYFEIGNPNDRVMIRYTHSWLIGSEYFCILCWLFLINFEQSKYPNPWFILE